MALDLRAPKPFPTVIDNTILVEYRSCPRRFFYRFIHDLAPRGGLSIHLHAGTIFALGVEHVRRKVFGPERLDLDSALVSAFKPMALAWGRVDPGDHPKNFVGVYSALEYYFDIYKPATDHIRPLILNDEPAVEFSFVLPIDVLHPETGDPILFCGRFDQLGLLHGETQIGEDEKTCTQLGPKWTAKWKLRSQFTGYTWGAQQYGHRLSTFVIRALCFRDRVNGPLFDTVEAIVYRPPWLVEAWLDGLHRTVRDMIRDWREWTEKPEDLSPFRQAFNDACSEYGGCAYTLLCNTPDPNGWLTEYETRHWDPTHRPLAGPADAISTQGDEE
jgi:hypothetical protein